MVYDNEILKNIQDAVSWDSRIDVTKVEYEILKGNVKLKGSIPTYYMKIIIESLIQIIPGVYLIDNQLKVELYEIDKLDDITIEDAIFKNIRWNPVLDPKDLDIKVEMGKVVLSGFVDAYWKKLVITDIASAIKGISDLTNEITILPNANYDDKILADNITNIFEKNKIDLKKLDLAINKGVVNVTGVVENWNIYNFIQRLLRNIDGISDIKLKIKIGE